MKIILIYQAATDMPWAASYDAASFERAAAEELLRPAAPVHVKKGDASAYRIYTGTAPASVRTAELLFVALILLFWLLRNLPGFAFRAP